MRMSAPGNWNCRKMKCTRRPTGSRSERPLLESLPYSISERQSGMFGLLHALESVATLLLMCDGRDLGTAIGEKPPAPGAESETILPMRLEEAVGANAKEFFEPNLYLFDAYPGGIGFSEPLFRAHALAGRENTRIDPGLPLRGGVSVVRRPGRGSGAQGKGSSAGDSGRYLRMRITVHLENPGNGRRQ